MKQLDYNEMKLIKAGALSAGAWALIAAGISFIAGILDGYTRPFKCR